MAHDDPDHPHHHHSPAASPSPSSGSVPEQHKARGPKYVRAHVVTCSDSRTPENDEGGKIIKSMLADRGHVLSGYAIVRDEAPLILEQLRHAKSDGAQVVLITGGTGISRRDRTFDAVSKAITRTLPGFGELFRMLSFQEIGSASMMSRATAGITADGLVVFAMPGSPAAVRLACSRLILPELTHLIEELSR